MSELNVEDVKNFFSSYFHEDWAEEAENPEDIVANYLEEGWSADELAALSREIERFAAAYVDDNALQEALFRELGCYYLPSADGKTARDWLREVTEALTKRKSP